MTELIAHAERKFKKFLSDATKPFEADHSALTSQLSSELKDSFRQVVELCLRQNEWNTFFELVTTIEQALSTASKSNISWFQLDDLFRLVGDVFYSVNYKPTAFEYYKKSIRLSDETNLFAVESLENLIDECMERWHFKMINDSVRNRAYSMAIFKRLEHLRTQLPKRDVRILDIGSGTGLLAALCLSNSLNFGSSNIRIYTCEQNDFFYQICSRFIHSIDKTQDRVKVINKNSSNLDLNEDLDGSAVDLIVTEIFDDGLLGEACLQTLYDALYVNKLVHPSSSRLITQSARIFVCAIESARLRASSSFVASDLNVNVRCLSNSERFEREFDTSELNLEPYTSENLNLLDDIESLAQPQEIVEFRIAFDDEKLLERLCKLGESIQVKKHLPATRSGRLDAFVLWFELYLDEDVILTNCPAFLRRPKSAAQICQCWDQAVYHVAKPVDVREGELIGVDCKLRSDCFLINLSEKKNTPDTSSIWLSEFEIRLLNNSCYQDFFTNWFENELKTVSSDLTVGVLSNTFSVILFNLMLKYQTTLLTTKNVRLKIELFVSSEHEFGRNLAACVADRWPHNNVTIHLLNELKSQQRYKLDYLIVEPLDVKFGVLKRNLQAELQLITSCNSNKQLKLFPQFVRLKSALIESDTLLKDSQLVSNKNLCIEPFDGAKQVDLEQFLVEYYTPQQYSLNINLNLANFKQLTEIRDNLELSLFELDSFEQEVRNFEVKVIESGRIDFVFYWYELSSSDGRSLYSPVANGLGTTAFWNQVVGFSLSPDKKKLIDASQHEVVKFDFLFKNQVFYPRNFALDARE